MRRWAIRVGVLAVLVVLGWLGWRTWLRDEPVPVRVVTVERGAVSATVTNSKAGTVKARRRAQLAPQASGLVAAIPFREGAHVKAGEVILRLEDSTQQAATTLAREQLAVARARHERACLEASRAERELNRNRELAHQSIIPTDTLDALESRWELAVAACQVALAEVSQADAGVASAETELAKTLLRAPFDGVVAEVATEVGEWVSPSPPLLSIPAVLDLIDPTSLYISAPMDEVDSMRVRVGQEVRVTLDPLPGRSFPGRVVRVAPYVLDIEAQNRTVEIEVELDGADEPPTVLAGTSSDVEVVLDTRDDVLWIPTQALIEGERVLLVEDDVLVERKVRPGLRNWDRTEIIEGLSAGERVVTSLERADVRAGARVTVTDGSGP